MATAELLQDAALWLHRRMQQRIPFDARNPFLEGPFAPVAEETTSTALRVSGRIPHELDGILARIGPNPRHVANPAAHHWFMGDGMVHGLRLAEGTAQWYRSRFVGVDSVRRDQGLPPLPGPRRGVADVVNTNIIGHAGELWALVEAGACPVALDTRLESRRHGLFASPARLGFSAHPHADPATGELHAICYDGFDQRHLYHRVIDARGALVRDEPVRVQHGPMVHDCALTQGHVVVLDLPVTFSLRQALGGAALPYAWNPRHAARVGLLPRTGSGRDVRWFEVEPCFVFHTANAHDLPDGGAVLDVVVHARMFDRSRQGPEDQAVTFERWTLEARTGRVQRQVLSRERQEFPRYDERRTGQPYRYAYAVGIDVAAPRPNALYRHDLATGETRTHAYGPGLLGGEAVFVPRHAGAGEDEGWLLSYVHDLAGGPGRVVILNADDLGGAPQAEIELPVRVPLGFHGNWIPTAAETAGPGTAAGAA
ncbi:MAG TPA: carotenoid oxygenase family protein [Moraxellaceae bacterium]|nr:carotenoid oxygenase family protein [Moraxellaceae bacterium]